MTQLDFPGTARWNPETQEFCFKPKNIPATLQWIMRQDAKKTYTCELKEFRRKRSKNANDYCWVLCEKLAQALHMEKDDVYRDQIKSVGVFKDFHLNEAEEKSFCTAWGMLGTGWVTERVDFSGDMVTVRAYYGSSRYNTKQMARLLDHLIQDCSACGIETITPKEAALLLDDWRESHAQK